MGTRGSDSDVPLHRLREHRCPVVPTSFSLACIVVFVLLALLAIAAVTLRFYAQRKSKHRVGWDGILLIIALIISVGHCVLGIWAALCGGLGWPLIWLRGPTSLRFERSIDAGQVLWGFSVTLIRWSLLLYYRRIFATKQFQRTTMVVMVINGCWLLVYIVITALMFNITSEQQITINYPAWLLSNGCLDILLDLAILCLPLFVIRKLNIINGQRFGVAAIFSLGAFCVIASVVRLVYLIQLARIRESDGQWGDITYKTSLWAAIQPCASIIAACLPTYAAYLRIAAAGFSRVSTKTRSLLAICRRRSQDSSHEPKLIDSDSVRAPSETDCETVISQEDDQHAKYGNLVVYKEQTFQVDRDPPNSPEKEHNSYF